MAHRVDTAEGRLGSMPPSGGGLRRGEGGFKVEGGGRGASAGGGGFKVEGDFKVEGGGADVEGGGAG